MKNKILILNGPNLNLLGVREPGKYGSTSFEEFFSQLKEKYDNLELNYFQSNIEGELINEIQRAGLNSEGIIINAGGYSHTSVAIRDAISSVNTLCIEVHITNIYAREEFRHHSLLSAVCKGVVAGLGLKGYDLAIQSLIELIHTKKT